MKDGKRFRPSLSSELKHIVNRAENRDSLVVNKTMEVLNDKPLCKCHVEDTC